MERVLSRLSRSPVHFNKFFDILVEFVVSENHPEWDNRALRWLDKIFESPELAAMTKQSQSSLCRFLSFSAEIHGLRQLVDAAVETMDSVPKKIKPRFKKSPLPILDTGYVFIDDHEVNFGITKKRSRCNPNDVKEEQDEYDQPSLLSDEGDDSTSDDYEDDGEVPAFSEDDGVFDVDNVSTSSLAESQMSTTLPQAQFSDNQSNNTDSSSEGCNDINICEDDDSGSEDAGGEWGRTDVPPQSDLEGEERAGGVCAAFDGSSNSEAAQGLFAMGEAIGPSGLSEESQELSALIRKHRGRIVVYTGAGVSTAANIPDYRGTRGLYRNSNGSGRRVVGTKLRLPEASFAKPTFTHMAIHALVSHGYVRHVVSQNVDCLHLRSGLSRKYLSELHGNLFIEQCLSCNKLTYRAFDVAENTAKGRHLTGRVCPFCCDALTFSSLQRAIALETMKLLIEKKCVSKDDSVAAVHRAAQNIWKDFDQREGRPPPLLHDVIIHYGERLAVDESVNQISAAIRAINGSKPPATPETASSSAAASGATGAVTATDDGCAPAKPIPAPGDSTSDVDADSAPVSLILVIGTSLTVLRSYSFLWPRGLRRCLSAGTKGGDGSTRSPKRPRLSPDPETPTTLTTPTKTGTETVVSDDRMEGCELAIINMQRTCKDGLATFVSRRECDDLLRETVEGCLGLSVPTYDADRDPLRELFIPLSPEEEDTRTRPNIFHL
ncbi:NAD-dependent protein deacetylase sirtuin-7 [Taenia crassiceps]|uniref:Regulatory protein SIR2 homolog 7 n=1 Tax=Taenia crassiceps TaxID=6207 RepID=A0ABR4Q208_9CEST